MITTTNYKKENGQVSKDFPLQGRKNSGPGFAQGQVKIIQWVGEIRLGSLVTVRVAHNLQDCKVNKTMINLKVNHTLLVFVF